MSVAVRVLRTGLALCVLCTLCVGGVARAEPTDPSASDYRGTDGVVWRAKRSYTYGTADYIVTGSAVGITLGTAIINPPSKHVAGGILVDEDVRTALRVHSEVGRYTVRDMSDVGVSLASTWPFLVDALITGWWYRGNAELARNMALVSAEAFTVAAAAQGIANQAASRERPFGRNCGKTIPENSVDCDESVRYRSFFSGHTTLAFTSAGVLCMNHFGLGLLGANGDLATCIGAYTVATATSVFRIMGDMHYFSDVVVGALVGTAAGITVPLFHLRHLDTRQAGHVEMRLAPVGQGVGVAGSF